MTTKFIVAAATGAAVAGTGIIAYSTQHPEVRQKIEENIPATKILYKRLLDNNSAGIQHNPVAIPKLKDKKKVEEIEKEKKPQESKADDKVVVSPIASSETKSSSNPPAKGSNPYKGIDPEKAKKALETDLMAALNKAESGVRAATNAKIETIRAIEHHIQIIREAVEAGPSGDWDAVIAAHSAAEKKTLEDMQAEKEGKKAIDALDKVINLGSQGETTVLHPLLATSRETAAKHRRELEEMVNMIKKVDTERVFTRDYGNLVEEGRRRFAKELQAVMPEADWTKGSKSLNQAQLNSLLAHAHLRVDQLRRQLIDMKLSEENRIKKSVEVMREDELKKIALKNEKIEHSEKELALIKENFDEELKKRLEEMEANYAQQLKEVVVTQKQLYDIEHAKDVDNAVQSERKTHSAVISRAMAQLDGIETALKSRVALDAENRRTKQVWLAVQNLVDSIEYGKKGSCCIEGRRLPLSRQIKTLQTCAGEDKFIQCVASIMPKTSLVKGEYTREDLNCRFNKVYKVASRISHLDINGGGVCAHLFSWLQSVLTFRLPLKYAYDEKIDPTSMSNQQLLDRARYFMSHEDVVQAVKLLKLTKGPVKNIATDFIEDARRHEETLLLARMMLAHAAVTSIRSTY